MRIIRLIQVNLRKAIASYGFLACILLTTILFFTSPLYYDYNVNSDVSILQAFLKFDRKEMMYDTKFCSYNVLCECVSGWLKMFIPMIASFPFVSLQCTERSTGAVRFSGIRLSKQSYQTGTFLSAMIIGGLVLIFGFLLFNICINFTFPNISEYDTSLREFYERSFSDTYSLFNKFGYPYLIILRFIEMFLYGAVSAVPACFITCMLKNKYLVISIPLFLKYILLQHISRLQTEAYENIEHINERRIFLLKMINPDLISRIFFGEEEIWKNILFYSILILFAFITYSIIMNRRRDYAA